MQCTRLAENTGRKKSPKSRTTLSGCTFASKARIDNRKKACLLCFSTQNYARFTAKFLIGLQKTASLHRDSPTGGLILARTSANEPSYVGTRKSTLSFSLFVRLRKTDFWATVCKTVRPILPDRSLICMFCPVCNVAVLCPNGWMDQRATWHWW